MKTYLCLAIIACMSLPLSLSANSVVLTATLHNNWVCGNGVKEPGEQCDGADFGGSLCSTSGFTGGSLSCSVSCQLVFSSCTTDADNAAVAYFPATGDTFTFSNGDLTNDTTTIVVPPLADPDPLTFEAFPYPPADIEPVEPAPEGTDFAAKVYSFYFVSADGEVLHELNAPVTVTMPYADQDISSLDESTLRPYRKESGDPDWQEIPGATVNAADNTVTFQTSHFSLFTIFGRPKAAVQEETSQSSAVIGGSGGATVAGSNVTIRGRASAGSTVRLLKDSQALASVLVGADGAFSFTLKSVVPGYYTFGLISEKPDGTRTPLRTFSSTLSAGKDADFGNISIESLLQGELPLPPAAPASTPTGDVNADGRVDLVDFSIMAYWYGRPHPPALVDLNADGKVDLVDFSIIAYHWTG